MAPRHAQPRGSRRGWPRTTRPGRRADRSPVPSHGLSSSAKPATLNRPSAAPLASYPPATSSSRMCSSLRSSARPGLRSRAFTSPSKAMAAPVCGVANRAAAPSRPPRGSRRARGRGRSPARLRRHRGQPRDGRRVRPTPGRASRGADRGSATRRCGRPRPRPVPLVHPGPAPRSITWRPGPVVSNGPARLSHLPRSQA